MLSKKGSAIFIQSYNILPGNSQNSLKEEEYPDYQEHALTGAEITKISVGTQIAHELFQDPKDPFTVTKKNLNFQRKIRIQLKFIQT